MVRHPVLGVDFLTRLTHPQIEVVPHPSEVNDPANGQELLETEL